MAARPTKRRAVAICLEIDLTGISLCPQKRPIADFDGPYSITSSARSTKVEGTGSPSTLAAFRLMRSSSLVDC